MIITTYNRSKLLAKAIDSVLKQSYSDFEIIVVDDGSTDDTAQTVEEFTDSRIKYFYKNNGGQSSAENYGLAKAEGDFISFLDSDDIWLPKHLETMLKSLSDNKEYSAAYCLYKDHYPDGKIQDGYGKDRYISGWMTIPYYKRTPHILTSTTLFRKHIWEGSWWDEEVKNWTDMDAFLRISTKTPFLFVPDTYLIRRKMGDSIFDIDREENISPYAALVFDRFYYCLGGKKIIPAKTALQKLSKEYRNLAKKHYLKGNRKAAISLYLRAIKRYPWELKNYKGLRKAFFLNKIKDKLPDWKMPQCLPPYISALGKKCYFYA